MYRNHSFNPPSEEAEKAFAEKAPTITLQGAHQQSEAFWESQRPEEAMRRNRKHFQIPSHRLRLATDLSGAHEYPEGWCSHDDNAFILIIKKIHGGDYTEFGMTKEFEWAVERLNQLRVPYAGLIGNHDILGNGHEVYAELFGDD